MPVQLTAPPASYLAFWRERHICTLTTLRPDGTPHVVAVGATLDHAAGLARVTTNRNSRKARNVLAAGPEGAPVAVCQAEGPRWATLEGRARLLTGEEEIEEAVRRYAERYGRTPAPNPERSVIEITLTRLLGNA
ncbi:TIGR03618 family F420-dependent PPOX class oxidoreductase [Streptomyces sp. SID11385]|uniref:pyridoxamine 5'-phosphate oxidase family protein n=1 Tax=Streptomyces sp. SID11385 TaxID=2706031 RepID=UPI0013C796A6|nr:TIGR03618 family F420-dependent PPOX class oxidoreductase [Streptomyces sp. SID11385]NEA44432.1 TIGR03618 family F420-dependent PPOX class oxidoreductase [Streptomyces sp. SID11385]